VLMSIVHYGNHWLLLVAAVGCYGGVDPPLVRGVVFDGMARGFDSWKDMLEDIGDGLHKYLVANGFALERSHVEMRAAPPHGTQEAHLLQEHALLSQRDLATPQNDGRSCGVYALATLERLLRDEDLTGAASRCGWDLRRYRSMMVWSFLHAQEHTHLPPFQAHVPVSAYSIPWTVTDDDTVRSIASRLRRQ
jgi:hypothetical protein